MIFGRDVFPMTKDDGCSRYARLSYSTPRKYDPKRVYPWLTDVTQPGILSSKKQAVEATTNTPDFLQWSVYPLDRSFNYQATPHQVRGGLASRPSQFLYMVDVPLDTGVLSVGMKHKNACQGDASVNSNNLRKILNAKVNHVCDSKDIVSASKTNFLRRADDGRLLRSAGCNKYYGRFLSLGNPCLTKDGNNTSMDVIRNEGLDLSLTLGQIYEEKKDIIVSGRADEGPMEHAPGLVIADKKAFADNDVIVDYPNYAHLSRATRQANTVEWNAYQNNIPKHVICRGGHNVHLSVGCNSKEKGNILVSGAAKVSANDEALLENQNSTQSSEATSGLGTIVPNAYPSSEKNSNHGGNSKEQNGQLKTASGPRPNLYPSSILCLLSTGIFNGAPVKYICESRDSTLCGVIKGSKILCSCNKCNYSEYIGPCKFERHAGGKTKRPNSHIYFENGRTIYEVFHELRNTSEDKFFYAIQKIAGSAVNQLNFHIWKGRSNLRTLHSAPSPM